MAKIKHGHCIHRTSTYYSWASMKSRCNNKRDACYIRKNITYCSSWEEFSNFLKDMGERPINTSLDRIDSTRNYEKLNCRWSSSSTQARNAQTKSSSG